MADNFKELQNNFVNLIEGDKLFHAYLFFGEDVGGIMEFSKMLANFLENGDFDNSGKFLNDFIAIEPNEHNNIGIDEIRQMQKFLYQFPVASKKRTAIIYGADSLTDEAQGGILKIIEEPPQKSLIILIAKDKSSILPTIGSRVHKIYFFGETLNYAKRKESPKDAKEGETQKDAEEKQSRKAAEEDVDAFLKKTLVDLSKNLSQNTDIAKEVLSRIASMKQYNLNNKLQMRVLEKIIKSQEH